MISQRYFKKWRQRNLSKMLYDIIESLNKNNVDYWVDYGTLLGLVRDGDVILGDNDIDISLRFNKDLPYQMVSVTDSLPTGYHLVYLKWGYNGCYRIISDSYKILYSDMYLQNEDGEYYVDFEGKIPKELVGNKTTIKWKGLDVKVPEHYIKALEFRYGKDWNIPQDKKSIH